jgi:zinc transporter
MTRSEKPFLEALLLDGKGRARPLEVDEVNRWQPDDGTLWIDLNLSNKLARKWLRASDIVDPGATEILLAAETRPRSLVHGDGMIAVMRGINMNPGAVPDDMVAIRMFLQKDIIVTSRRRRVLSIRDVRDALLSGTGPATTGQFLVMLTSALAGRIEAAVEKIEIALEEISGRLAAGDVETVRTDLGIARRQAAVIRRHLAPQRDATDRLTRSPAGLLGEPEIFDLREVGDNLTRHIEDLDLARENALVAQEELTNRIAMEQNARMYLLSIVAAIFLPLSFVTGLLGMNVAGLPGTDNPNGFLISALVMVVLGIGLVAFFRWKKWV